MKLSAGLLCSGVYNEAVHTIKGHGLVTGSHPVNRGGIMSKKYVIGSVLVLALAAAALAQQADESAQATDTLFISAASQSNVYEIGAARLAVENAQSQEVTELAQMIIDDHTKATSELLTVAEGLDATPIADPSGGQQLMLNYLGTLSGAEFDSAYLEQQVVAHEEAIGLFEIASTMAQDEPLKTFATETLPALEEHLQMAQEAMQASGGN